MDGLRGPRGARQEYAERNPNPLLDPPIGKGTTYYCEKYARLRIQITSPPEIATGGRVHRDRPLSAQFENHFYVNTASKVRKVEYGDEKLTEYDLVDKILQEHPEFASPKAGTRGIFCLWSENREVEKQSRMDAAIAQAEQNPEIIEELLKRRASKITQGEDQDFKLPAKKKGSN
jgi:hypothetical protein